MTMFQSVTLFGPTSGRDTGEGAVLAATMAAIDAAAGRQLLYEIPTTKPKLVSQAFSRHRVRTLPMKPWNLALGIVGAPTFQSMRRTDLTLVASADFSAEALFNPFASSPAALSIILSAAKRRGKRIGLCNIGIRPSDAPTFRRMLSAIATSAEFIAVRDSRSLELLRAIGVGEDKVIIGADSAHIAPFSEVSRCRNILTYCGVNPDEAILAVNLDSAFVTRPSSPFAAESAAEFVQHLAGALSRASAELAVQLLFVVTNLRDLTLTQRVMREVKTTQRVGLLSNAQFDHVDIKGTLGQVSLFFAMHYRALILAASQLTPIAGLSCDADVLAYFAELGLASACFSPEGSSGEGLSVENLWDHLRRSWETKSETAQKLHSRIESLQRDAYRVARVVATLSDDGGTLSEALRATQRAETRVNE